MIEEFKAWIMKHEGRKYLRLGGCEWYEWVEEKDSWHWLYPEAEDELEKEFQRRSHADQKGNTDKDIL